MPPAGVPASPWLPSEGIPGWPGAPGAGRGEPGSVGIPPGEDGAPPGVDGIPPGEEGEEGEGIDGIPLGDEGEGIPPGGEEDGMPPGGEDDGIDGEGMLGAEEGEPGGVGGAGMPPAGDDEGELLGLGGIGIDWGELCCCCDSQAAKPAIRPQASASRARGAGRMWKVRITITSRVLSMLSLSCLVTPCCALLRQIRQGSSDQLKA